MNEEEYLRIYLALRTADPRYATSAIAALRLSMIHELGEEGQRKIVERGNAIPIQTNFSTVPWRVLDGYFTFLMIDAGLAVEDINKISHLIHDIFLPTTPATGVNNNHHGENNDVRRESRVSTQRHMHIHVGNRIEEIPDPEGGRESDRISERVVTSLRQQYNSRLENEDYSGARITSNRLLAYVLRENDRELALQAVNDTLRALNMWPGAREERGYEFEGNEWIRENIDMLLRTVQRALWRFQMDMEDMRR